MRPNSQEAEYARELATAKLATETAKQAEKDILASAKDAGLNVRTISKAAAELRMDSDKRAKKYDDEDQLDLLRDALGLTGNAMREAAE
jgi:uncharacterized protein (UPF0335 family)